MTDYMIRNPKLDYPELDCFADNGEIDYFTVRLKTRMILIELNQMRIEVEKLERTNEHLRKQNDEFSEDARRWRSFLRNGRVSER